MAVREYEVREAFQNKNDKKKNHSNKFLWGAIIGGMVGAAAALLYAPKAGKEFRKELIKKTTLFSENLFERNSDLPLSMKMKEEKERKFSISLDSIDGWEETETNYIPIKAPSGEELKRRLEETKKALEEEEKKVKL